ncbi:hypothetical protein [Methylobacterium mesophilicum]
MNAVVLSPLTEMQGYVRVIAGDSGSIKERINRAARELKLGFSRTRDLYYGDGRCAVRADELAAGRAAAQRRSDRAARRTADVDDTALAALVAVLGDVASALAARGYGEAADQIGLAQTVTRRALASVDQAGA